MSRSTHNPWRHRFAVLTALATLGLVGMGGLVTSHGVGMAVPDWPTSYGYNMFALPVSTWLTGGIFHEHTHRLWASFVGVLVVALTRWLGGRESRRSLTIIGIAEIVVGWLLLFLSPDLKGAGHFLSGIGSVVLLAGIVWVKNGTAVRPLPKLGWWAFGLVQVQGLLGGLRVVLDAQVVADLRLGTAFGILHACLGQAFLALLVVIALVTSRWWLERWAAARRAGLLLEIEQRAAPAADTPIRWWFLAGTTLIVLQLVIAATMRHQHAGLAISDFPLAHGKLWPAMDAAAIQNYNAQRLETMAANPITAFQIGLQMAHRLMALAILVCVGAVAWRVRRSAELQFCANRDDRNAPSRSSALQLRRLAFLWLGLIFIQFGLGAWTIWSNKAADVATAHVLVGALSLVTGVLGCIICFRRLARVMEAQGASVAGVSCTDRPVIATNS